MKFTTIAALSCIGLSHVSGQEDWDEDYINKYHDDDDYEEKE